MKQDELDLQNRRWISDYIDLDELKEGYLNLISSGVGTGKTYFVTHNLIEHSMNKLGIQGDEVLYVTSRRLIVDQQAENEGMEIYTKENRVELNKYWKREIDKQEAISKSDIIMMTYDKLINILMYRNSYNHKTLDRIKMVVFDEVHALLLDKFITDIDILKLWIKMTLDSGDKYILGMTATPKILTEEIGWGVKINKMNKHVISNYRAKELYCTDFRTLPSFIMSNHLNGRTLIMCKSYMDCQELKRKLPNSTILISQHNQYYTPAMNKLRDYIVRNNNIPDTFKDEDGTVKPLDILITTTTLREGVNLNEESGISNVICCFSDDIHIVQFCGRFRGNLEKIVVVDRFNKSNNLQSKNAYINRCRDKYNRYINNVKDNEWFDSIAHIVEDDAYTTKRFCMKNNVLQFLNYINDTWLLPSWEEDVDRYKIWKDEDKKEILQKAIECRISKNPPSQTSFLMIMNTLRDVYGYSIIKDREYYDKTKRRTYTLIVDYDKDIYLTKYEQTPKWMRGDN